MRFITTALVLCLSGAAAAAPAQPDASQAPPSAARVKALADAYVDEYKRAFPEQATFSGLALERHDAMTDNSQAALRRWMAREDEWTTELAKLDARELVGRPEWIVHGFLREALESSRRVRLCRYDLWPVNQMSGWQVAMAQLASIQPVGSEEARTQALARWRKLPTYLANEVENLRLGLRQGYSTPKRNVELVIDQLDQLLAQPVEKWPLYQPATRDKSRAFRKAWGELLSSEIKPAITSYRDYLRNTYAPKARTAMAITANPNGASCYQAAFRSYTTIERPARETFELGRRTVEANKAAALEIGRQSLKADDLPTLLQRLDKDPANRFASREQMLQFARAAVERSRKDLPRWFARLPKATIVVEPYPEFLERTASDSYWPAAEDGSRPAMYRINLRDYAESTRSNAEITAFHEAYPGHHLQIGIASERPESHPITRLVGNSGFSEGWARYAEALAEEMNLYSSEHGRANRRLWPARGMVVDPGIHLYGWTREQAVAFMAESGRFPPPAIESTVDRIAAWPGQLTAYDTGALEFFALRKEAEAALGEAFDIREFHAALLENGSVTLPMLREQVTRWIAAQRE